MNIGIVTKDDLERFNKELFEEIRHLALYPRKDGDASKTWLKSNKVRRILGILSVHSKTCDYGTLPFSKIGGLLYYKYEDILKLIEVKMTLIDYFKILFLNVLF